MVLDAVGPLPLDELENNWEKIGELATRAYAWIRSQAPVFTPEGEQI